MSFNKFMSELNGSRVEGELIKTVLFSLCTSLILVAALYLVKLALIPDFMSRYGFFLFLAILSYASILPAIRQVRAYKTLPCMSGMMVGMTIGMVAGFLAGFYIGATNGMFWGSVFGMAIGIFFGAWLGSCCGIMGFMEGIMAGFMGGIMGAMTAVMLLNDHLQASAIIVFVVCEVILIGLSYMIYRETQEAQREVQEDYFFVIVASFILTLLTLYLMVFGPRSFLFQ